jgi:hypothetical protein
MRKIVLTADDGQPLTGHLPESWAEVPLAGYAALAGADGLPARVEAAAALLGLPAGPLLEDVSLFATLAEQAPWLFGDELPEPELPVAYFTHQGITYHHQGDLQKISAGQMEALLTFLRLNEGHHLACAPHLLAVLYCPQGQSQTPAVVQAAATALATLPMSVAWPALASKTCISLLDLHRYAIPD